MLHTTWSEALEVPSLRRGTVCRRDTEETYWSPLESPPEFSMMVKLGLAAEHERGSGCTHLTRDLR